MKNRVLNIPILLILILILSSFPAFAATQEVNITIERNNFYKIDLPIREGDKLNVNLTANNSIDVFIFSEQELINYEVNNIIKPSHMSWFKLNTTSFHLNNITIIPPGIYFMVVDNTVFPSNGKKSNISVTLNGKISVYPSETSINYGLIYTLIALLIIIVILYIIYIFKYIKKDEIVQSTYFFFSVVIIGFLISLIGYFLHTSYEESILVFLYSLIQLLAGLLALLFTMTLIITQILAQTYPFQITKYIVKSKPIIRFFFFYLVTIILGIFIIISKTTTYWSVTSFVFLSIVLIAAMLPYTFNILEEFKPKKIIGHFIKGIERQNILLEAENLGEGDRSKFCPDKIKQSEDPLQPLSDIALNAISKQNHEIVRIVICELNTKSKELISNENNEEETKKIVKLFGYHLSHISKTAIANKDVESLDLIIKTMQNLSKLPKHELSINEAIDYLIMVGLYCATNGLVSNAYNTIDIMRDAASKRNLRVTSSSAIGIKTIGDVLIKNRSVDVWQPSIIGNFRDIAKNLLGEIEFMNQNLENLRSNSFLGTLPINFNIYDEHTSSNKQLEDIVKEREKRIIELLQDDIRIIITEMRRLAKAHEIQEEINSANSVLNFIIQTSDNQDIKESYSYNLNTSP